MDLQFANNILNMNLYIHIACTYFVALSYMCIESVYTFLLCN